MKTKAPLFIAIISILTFSSCKKCFDCQSDGSTHVEELCKPSDMSWKGWNDYIKDYEEGYDAKCK